MFFNVTKLFQFAPTQHQYLRRLIYVMIKVSFFASTVPPDSDLNIINFTGAQSQRKRGFHRHFMLEQGHLAV